MIACDNRPPTGRGPLRVTRPHGSFLVILPAK